MKESLERRRTEAGQSLWRARKNAGLTGKRLAELTGIGQSQISKIENGLMLPSYEDLATVLAALNLTEQEAYKISSQIEEIRTEVVSWRVAHKFGLAKKQLEIDEIEAQSSHIRNFETFLVPGLLQTKEYAKCVLKYFNITGQKDLEDAVDARIFRQRILLDQKKRFEFVIMDYALLSRFFPTQVLLAQLDHILSIQALSNLKVMVQEISRVRGIPVDAGFHIFESKIVIAEGTTAEIRVSGLKDIRKFEQKFEELSRNALRGSRAVAFIRKCKDVLSDQPS
ncbi:MAG TPA: helix-turn-helix transcriptional regulator [Candidatus Baltobacteraceae bacterium]|jgi:transcriptional regulator with XRE-family HTH domain|nr:helix-turn-helix transcriptional regulator [Candidatus Baltobacteraceae bacterium]